jgi:antitoxin CptB
MDEKEILWKCRRGTKELDLLMTDFFNLHYKKATKSQKTGFIKLLSYEDPIIYDLILKKISLKDIEVNEIADMIRTMRSKNFCS